MKTKTINQIGIQISGIATLVDWDNSIMGTVNMKEYFLSNEFITPKNILRCVNDNGFGCLRISSADIIIHTKYNNGSIEYAKDLMDINNPLHTQYFLGWSHLREIGAIK